MSTPILSDLDTINMPQMERGMIQAAIEAVNSVSAGWEFLRMYEPPEDQGFMFSESVGKRKEIEDAIENRYPEHSGASFAITMRVLESIAKEGWDTYIQSLQKQYGSKETIEEKRQRFLALPENMTMEQQIQAIQEFKDVPMSYAEMRARFG